jgi:hypothetical protein
MKLIFKQILAYKYELMAFLGAVVSINTNFEIGLTVLTGGILGMIANTTITGLNNDNK